jgi:hypothetical protein
MPDPQLDLFADDPKAAPRGLGFVAPPEMVERIRAELLATLERVRAAEALPWPDLTQATLGEMRFRSVSRYLPEEEAAALRAAFDVEMARLWEAERARFDAAQG